MVSSAAADLCQLHHFASLYKNRHITITPIPHLIQGNVEAYVGCSYPCIGTDRLIEQR